MRIAKVRTTDYRPRAGTSSPLEAGRPTRGGSMSGLDHLLANQASAKTEHDRAIADYEEITLLAMAKDLGQRHAWNRKDHEQRWIMDRLAAVLRRLNQLKAFEP